jgi:putative transcriptional regulator
MNTPITKDDIKGLRKFYDESQSDFAKSLGVSVDTIRKWEQGKAKPSQMAYQKLRKLVDKIKKVKEIK